jgi:hypothetical protein
VRGCGERLGDGEVLGLADGTWVHFVDEGCLLRYGGRRGVVTAAGPMMAPGSAAGADSAAEWHEGLALLRRDDPPRDVPGRRWAQFIDDARRLVDDGTIVRALDLGWGPLDLFGYNRARPFARIDQAGLLWLLNGERLLALTEHTATIETRSCSRQTHRCRGAELGRVLAWEPAP